jgi:hypothetical protein
MVVAALLGIEIVGWVGGPFGALLGAVGGWLLAQEGTWEPAPGPRVTLARRLRLLRKQVTTNALGGVLLGLGYGVPIGLLAGLLYTILVWEPAKVVLYVPAAVAVFSAASLIGWGVFGFAILVITQFNTRPEERMVGMPVPLSRADPQAVLRATSRNAWAGAIVGGVTATIVIAAVGAGVGALLGLVPDGPRDALRSAAAVVGVGAPLYGLLSTLAFALSLGMKSWLYHHWIRYRFARVGLLPQRLPAFLDWCAEDARGWLVATDAYEFRHRELLDHLALCSRRRT